MIYILKEKFAERNLKKKLNQWRHMKYHNEKDSILSMATVPYSTTIQCNAFYPFHRI